ncbi:TetR family transcriptional regulator [Micromonospora qiuiae]|uniref:TetR family transcriptional regulator n=1 Tax=Micromonospora qiuiae TaxID=502268 RepID=A0ABQ4JJM0_9ACTN|nr:TetR/AcrR family transcriptional regulator [Micromonospora qiuiae]GIJ30796.1 TetR family transcriptional regulator [Micromonospora qiuiae]
MAPRTRASKTGQALSGRPLRADAQRNRARILAAAEATLADKGPSASTEEIAHRAEVAVGTIFRHFPTKEALVEAVFVAGLRQLAEQARRLCTAPEPGAAFITFLTEAITRSTAKHAFARQMGGDNTAVMSRGPVAEAAQDLRRAMTALLDRAQRAKEIRGDIDITAVVALLVGASRAAEHTDGDERLRETVLAVVVDGLRPRDADRWAREDPSPQDQ